MLCFPFIFRGALDVGATTINEEMKLACVHAIAELAHAEQSDVVAQAYGGEDLSFGPDYLIPKPFDPRLMVIVPPAVAKAAMDSGVATRPIADFDAYRERLSQFVYRSGLIMKPVFARRQARAAARRLRRGRGRARAAGGADRRRRGPRATDPDRPPRGDRRADREVRPAHRRRPRLRPRQLNSDPRYRECWQLYYQLMGRNGISPEDAKEAVLRSRR